MGEKRALFLDLDGTVRRTKSGKPCPNEPEDQELLPGRKEKIKEFKNNGYLIIGVTNQGGVGLGYMTEDQNTACIRELQRQADGMFDAIYSATAKPSEKHWDTKPNPGMLQRAERTFTLSMRDSIMVGDRDTDERAGRNAGVGTFIWAHEFFGDKHDSDAIENRRSSNAAAEDGVGSDMDPRPYA